MLCRLVYYIKYFLFAGHRKGHGIHSPFVFRLITEVLRNKTAPEVVFNIEKVRKRLKTDRRIINVADPGSGSEKLKGDKRRVSEIVRYSSVPEKYGILLYNLSGEFGREHIIELGTSLGISALYLSFGSQGSIIHTIEGSVGIAEIARETFEAAGTNNIVLYEGTFEEVLPAILNSGIKPGLVFIDGNHRKEHVLSYFRMLNAVAGKETVLVFDDIRYSISMYEAWQEIKKQGRVSLTIDLGRMGLVFFREGIAHNDYIIRY